MNSFIFLSKRRALILLASLLAVGLSGCNIGGKHKLEYVKIVPATNTPVENGTIVTSPCFDQTLHLIGTFSTGNQQDFTYEPDTKWTSSDPSVVKVSNGGSTTKGTLIPQGSGTATVTGDFETLKDSIKVRVVNSQIKISPPVSTLAIDTGEQLHAEEILTDSSSSTQNRVRDITSSVTWSTSGPISVDSSGMATAVPSGGSTSGSATVTAVPPECTVTGSSPQAPENPAQINVTNTQLQSLEVTSDNTSGAGYGTAGTLNLPVGGKEALQIFGKFADGTTQNLTAQLAQEAQTLYSNTSSESVFTPYSSSGNAAAFTAGSSNTSISNPYNAISAVSAGSTTATVTFNPANSPVSASHNSDQATVSGTLGVTVLNSSLKSFSISPNDASNGTTTASVGGGQKYTATATYDNSNVGKNGDGTLNETTDPHMFLKSSDISLAIPQNDVTAPGLVLANVSGDTGQLTITGELLNNSLDSLTNTNTDTTNTVNVDDTLPTSVSISDPNSCASKVAAGSPCQLKAEASFSINGNTVTEDVTRFAIWQVNDTSVARAGEWLSYGGQIFAASGASSGNSTTVTASFRGVSSSTQSVQIQ